MNIVIIGAGAVGRGLIGKIFIEADHNVTFIESDRALWHALHRQSFYPCKEVGGQVHLLGVYDATLAGTGDARVAVQAADAIFVSVRVENVRDVAMWLAAVAQAHRNVPVFWVENMKDVVAVAEKFCRSDYQHYRGIAECVTPVPDEFKRSREPLFCYSDPFGYLVLPENVLPFLAPAGVLERKDMDFEWQLKWYLHCAFHCVVALIGLRNKQTLIRDVLTDDTYGSKTEAERIVNATARALALQYTDDEQVRRVYGRAAKELEQMRDPENIDTCKRVARDARRKAGEGERLDDLRQLLGGDALIGELMAYAQTLDL